MSTHNVLQGVIMTSLSGTCPSSQELKKVIIEIYCIKKCLLDLDPI
jgi:hypothetical protein